MNKQAHGSRLSAGILLFLSFFFALFGCATTQKPVVVNFPIRAQADSTPGTSPSQPEAEVQMPPSSLQPAQAPSAQPTPPASAQASPKPAIAVPLTDYNTPDNTPPDSAPQSDKDVQQLVTENNLRFEIHPEQVDYHGGAVVYNFVPNHIYQLFVAPLELSTVVLESGEQVVNAPAAGDTSNFMVACTYDIEDGQQIQRVLVKAVYAGKQTTLSINTNKRSYTFKVLSYDKLFMPLVSFNYPLDLAEKMKQDSTESQNRIMMYGRITDLDFGYTVIAHSVHRPSWMPDRVFNDGKKTYLSFPSASRASYAPVLFEVNEKNERVLLNYRVVGSYYIVDRVLRHAELILDVNEGNIISIIHNED